MLSNGEVQVGWTEERTIIKYFLIIRPKNIINIFKQVFTALEANLIKSLQCIHVLNIISSITDIKL